MRSKSESTRGSALLARFEEWGPALLEPCAPELCPVELPRPLVPVEEPYAPELPVVEPMPPVVEEP